MSKIRFVLLLPLFFNLLGCGPAPNTERARVLIVEANKLLEEDVRLADKWVMEYGRLFRPENRAQFPSNRGALRSSGDNLMTFVDESTRLNEGAAEKMEQAAGFMSSDKAKKGLNLMAASIRKSVEINGLMKEQMLLASDEKITDQKLFNEKFMTLMSLIQQKSKERDDQQTEGKELMGW